VSTSAPTASLLQVDDAAGYVRLAVVVVAFALLAALVNRLGGLQHGRADLRAAARATVQLAVVGLLIAAVLRSWWLTIGFVVVMLTVASVTAGRRLVPHGRWWWAVAPVWSSTVPVGVALLLSGLVPLTEVAVVPVLGILIGGAMTATTLAGRRTLDALTGRRGEVEAALSIGLETRDARILVARDDAGLALLPGLDQTRTVGLVTLPGAFVGMLLGGASPIQAAAVQLLVLVALLLVQAVATVFTLELIARDHMR
jgi:putative ABC transport system permease protein